MATSLRVLRGIPLPDANLTNLEEFWTVGGFAANQRSTRAASPSMVAADGSGYPYGAGSSVAFSLDNCPVGGTGSNYKITSGWTPYGVGAGPLEVSTDELYFYACVIARSVNVYNDNSIPLVSLQMIGCDSDDNELTTSTEESFSTLTYTDDSGYEWELHQITAHEVANVDTDVRHWKAVLRFYKPSSTPGYPRLLLDFVGLGLPFDEASATDGVMSTWYRGDVTDSWTSNRGGTRPVQGAYMPRMNASGIAAQGGAWNFAFEKLSSTDKRYLRSLWQWNDGGPTDGIEPGAHLNRYMPDRGARSPLLIVADRPDTKFGFYGDLAAPPQFQQSTPGWYPDDPRWRTSLRIVERIC